MNIIPINNMVFTLLLNVSMSLDIYILRQPNAPIIIRTDIICLEYFFNSISSPSYSIIAYMFIFLILFLRTFIKL